MDEVRKQEPLENDESQIADPDTISLPRRKIGSVQVLAGFFFIMAMSIISPFLYNLLTYEMYLIINTGVYANPIVLVRLLLIITSSLSMLFCGLVLVAFPGIEKKRIKTATIIYALSSAAIYIIYRSDVLFNSSVDFATTWTQCILHMARYVVLLAAIWIVLDWLPELRLSSQYKKEMFPRRKLNIACCLAVLYLICDKLALIIGFLDKIFSAYSSFDSGGVTVWLFWLLPLTLLVVMCGLYTSRRRRVTVLIIAFALIGIFLIENGLVWFSPLWEYRNIMEWLGATLAIFVPQVLAYSYPLIILGILPLRPLGKELFDQAKEKGNSKFSYYA